MRNRRWQLEDIEVVESVLWLVVTSALLLGLAVGAGLAQLIFF